MALTEVCLLCFFVFSPSQCNRTSVSFSDHLKFNANCVPPVKKVLWNNEECAVSHIRGRTTDLWLSHSYSPAQPLWGFPSVPLLLSWIDCPQHRLMHLLPSELWAWRLLALLLELIYFGKKKADIFKKQIEMWRGLWIIAISFLAYGTNWISGKVGWELSFKHNLLLVCWQTAWHILKMECELLCCFSFICIKHIQIHYC